MDRMCSRTGCWKRCLWRRILHSEELNKYYRAYEIKKHSMSPSCGTYGEGNVVLDSEGIT